METGVRLKLAGMISKIIVRGAFYDCNGKRYRAPASAGVARSTRIGHGM